MNTGPFKDHFSSQSQAYARHRPRYPAELFDWLADAAGGQDLAWDCGTGSGQAAIALAGRFHRVIATDASDRQLRHAPAHPGVEYRVEIAEASSLDSGSVDLVFVGQALHWFDLDEFYAEVRRVVRPGGVVAALTYQQVLIDPQIDEVIQWFYSEIVGPYWPPERRHVEQKYASLPFPFEQVPAPAFTLRLDWTLHDLVGYFSTWSSVARYRAEQGADPLAPLLPPLSKAWGEPDAKREACWPLVVLAGRSR